MSAGSFRLLTEPASLKQRAAGQYHDPQCEFPAPHRAGLIEAASRGMRAGTQPVSGSSQSRPH